jgi:hypothetical protein
MTDCPNVEIRELLPEYLGGTLSASRRAEVEAHLASCDDCAEELALLRLVRQAYASTTPTVDVGGIVAALPRKSVRPVRRSWRTSQAFQIAAAVSFIALGGISLTVARSFFGNDPTAITPDTMVASSAEMPLISFGGGVQDLGDEDLEALLSALESMEALPVTEAAEPLLDGLGRQGS